MKVKVMNKDTHTLCPAGDRSYLPLKAGTKVLYRGQKYTVKGSTEYMAWFVEKGGIPVGSASKGSPVEIEIEILTDEAEVDAA